MLLDRQNHVANRVALAAAANVTTLATDVIDLEDARDIGAGTGLQFYHLLHEAAPAGGTSVEFQIVTSNDPTFGSGVTVVASTGAIPLASLRQGYLTFQPVPRAPGGGKYSRYVTTRLVRAGTFTGNAVWSSGIVHDATDFLQFYQANFSV